VHGCIEGSPLSERLLHVVIQHETDVVLVRQRARELSELLGFDKQDQTRIATAVSEIARNAYEYARGGSVDFFIMGSTPPQLLEIVVTDRGPGIAQLEQVLDGTHRSQTGLGVGIVGARRLMDQFSITSDPAGTSVTLRKFLSRGAGLIAPAKIKSLMKQLAKPHPLDPIAEIRQQNHELLGSLNELRGQHDELERLNRELEDTNRGVVALYAELDERAGHLRRADELKSRFLSDMSHEFRTPLNSIMALSRLLLDRMDGDLSAEQEKQIRFIRKAAENLSELVNDLLDLAKVEAGKVDVRPIEFSLDTLFGTLRGMLRPLLVSDKVALVLEPVPELPSIFADENKVAQILRNFISNAIKFTERGEVRLAARLDADGNHVIISVSDTGIGIPSEHHATIFQDFVQIENPAQRYYKGTGLGLPLSKRLAVLLRGDITVESVAGQGSTFELHLPLRYEAAVESPQETVIETVSHGTVPVLILEDSPTDMYICERALANSRYQLLWARSVADARGQLARALPQVILLDLLLVGEDAWRFLASLKQDDATRHIPVIVVSTVDDRAKAQALGAEAYLLKPLERHVLVEALEFVTKNTQRRVLVIEDDETQRYILREYLSGEGYELSEATTGPEGLRAVEETLPDLVLLDIQLPEMDGYELLQRLAADRRTRHVPVIVVTSTLLSDADVSRLNGAKRILSKQDISSELLMGAVREVLQREYMQ